MRVDDTLAYLTGAWALERRIADRLTGEPGSFRGGGRLRTMGRRGRYEERGRLRLGGHETSAYRILEMIGGDDGRVAVRFADGRRFFDLDLRTGACRAVHPCSPDRYELEFRVCSSDLLIERWRVSGPAKDYEAETLWRRLPLSPDRPWPGRPGEAPDGAQPDPSARR